MNKKVLLNNYDNNLNLCVEVKDENLITLLNSAFSKFLSLKNIQSPSQNIISSLINCPFKFIKNKFIKNELVNFSIMHNQFIFDFTYNKKDNNHFLHQKNDNLLSLKISHVLLTNFNLNLFLINSNNKSSYLINLDDVNKLDDFKFLMSSFIYDCDNQSTFDSINFILFNKLDVEPYLFLFKKSSIKNNIPYILFFLSNQCNIKNSIMLFLKHNILESSFDNGNDFYTHLSKFYNISLFKDDFIYTYNCFDNYRYLTSNIPCTSKSNYAKI